MSSPFELSNKVTFKIANIEHWGFTKELDIDLSMEEHVSRELATRMKSDIGSFSIKAYNRTKVDNAVTRLVSKMKSLPGALNLTDHSFTEILEQPWKFTKFWQT